MNLSPINLKALLGAFGVSIVVFLSFYFFNHPVATLTPVEKTTNDAIPSLAPTTQVTTDTTILTADAYQKEFKSIVQSSNFAAASALDAFDANPAAMLDTQSPAYIELFDNLDQLSQNYHRAQEITVPTSFAKLHQDLIDCLALLDQANIDLLSSLENSNNDQAVQGYNELQTGLTQLADLATRL